MLHSSHRKRDVAELCVPEGSNSALDTGLDRVRAESALQDQRNAPGGNAREGMLHDPSRIFPMLN
jgi:hypothetical protein